jgi:hypothetical protein
LFAGLAWLGCSATAFATTGRELVVADRAVSVKVSGGEASTGGLGKLILGDLTITVRVIARHDAADFMVGAGLHRHEQLFER